MGENEINTNCKLCGMPAKKINLIDSDVYDCTICHRYKFASTFLVYTDERRHILRNFFQSLDEFDEKRNLLIINEEIFQKIAKGEI